MSCFLSNSSLGKKLVMSVTGCFLVLFILFHMSMNVTAILSPEAYNTICELLGANWYALVGTAVLALGVVVHFIYAIVLTLNNYRARGSQHYAVTVQEPGVTWASKNMLVLGVIVLLGLLLHLYNFWANMMLAELTGNAGACGIEPTDGAAFIAQTFGNPVYALIYIVWLVALWFHLTHGFWSAFQTLGINGKTWFCRWKVIGSVYVTVVVLAFVAVVLRFALCGGAC